MSRFQRLKKALARLPPEKRGIILARWEDWLWRQWKRFLEKHGYPQ